MRNTYTPPLQTITPSFSGHQTFPFRYTWLKKGVDAVAADPAIFLSKDASVALGVGKNMVDSIRHWCRASRLIEEEGQHRRGHFKVTDFGTVILGGKETTGFDPYLDDPATLWLIHYQIATNTHQATAWYWAFNVLRGNHFTPQAFAKAVAEWAYQQKQSMRPVSDNTLRRDVNCFIRTYCQSHHDPNVAVTEDSFDCPLVELNLIAELQDSNRYEFQRGLKETLPSEIITWVLDRFWKSRFPQTNSLSFSDLMYTPASPGRVFRLDEDTLTLYLEDLNRLTNGALVYDETAGLKQVYRHKDLNPKELLKRYYG